MRVGAAQPVCLLRVTPIKARAHTHLEPETGLGRGVAELLQRDGRVAVVVRGPGRLGLALGAVRWVVMSCSADRLPDTQALGAVRRRIGGVRHADRGQEPLQRLALLAAADVM